MRIACLQVALQPVREGLAEHHWSDAQLRELEAHLQQYNFVADVQPGFASERAAGILITENIRRYGLRNLAHLGVTGPLLTTDWRIANLISVFSPVNGWTYHEQYHLCHASLVLVGGTMDASQRRVFPSRTETNAREFERSFASGNFSALFHHRILAGMLLPALNRIITKAAIGQTVAGEAVLACALERYRLAHSQFPDELDALVPAFVSQLPHDVITGQPYRYRWTDDGRFVLYSVGWNEKDDGGVPGKALFDEKEGDWVWQYPAGQ